MKNFLETIARSILWIAYGFVLLFLGDTTISPAPPYITMESWYIPVIVILVSVVLFATATSGKGGTK